MKQYIVDAFTDTVFHGNQAAVCVLDEWLPDKTMMDIAAENNFSETAFTVKAGEGYDLRWFTPGDEINLCGHATLAAAYVLFNYYEKDTDRIVFHTLSGDLITERHGDGIKMDFPVYSLNKVPVTEEMASAMGAAPKEAYLDRDLLLVYEDEDIIRKMKPDIDKVKQLDGLGVGVTAPGKDYDCVSRFFVPELSIPEDPVTGSVHCMITPYWTERLGKSSLNAFQASKRGGELICELKGDRVIISGKAVLFAVSELML
ncbi:MAG: PhzF family phenazine biosynthesis protein [Lachnospiraceae bacterium]|nr:PhzF family phenazine biosynthesis protein [Lachnospiraceae bacterium]